MLACGAQLAVARAARPVLGLNTELDSRRSGDVVQKLSLFGLNLTVFNGSSATPTLEQLRRQCVFVWSGEGEFGENVAIGNVLAEYVHLGGHVVLAAFANAEYFPLGVHKAAATVRGQFQLAGMHPIPIQNVSSNGPQTIVRLISNHPLLDGVTSFDGGELCLRSTARVVAPGAVRVADWSSGEALVAVLDDKFNGSVVSLGLYPVSSSFYFKVLG